MDVLEDEDAGSSSAENCRAYKFDTFFLFVCLGFGEFTILGAVAALPSMPRPARPGRYMFKNSFSIFTTGLIEAQPIKRSQRLWRVHQDELIYGLLSISYNTNEKTRSGQ
jgi:hypothetical protein